MLHNATLAQRTQSTSPDSPKSVTVIIINDIQDKYTAREVRKLSTKFPIAVQEGEGDYDEHMDMTVSIQKMRSDIVNFGQPLNYVLLHATKPSTETHSIIRRPSRNSDTRQFTKQYYKWLEDINRYESENGQGTINDRVKIATVVNNLKGNIAQNFRKPSSAPKFLRIFQFFRKS
eukprot:4248914-Amphidinium_carterae.1